MNKTIIKNEKITNNIIKVLNLYININNNIFDKFNKIIFNYNYKLLIILKRYWNQ